MGFFVSYTKADEDWAGWVAWQLEDAGYEVTVQLWDFLAGSNFVGDIQKALTTHERTIAILSPEYLLAPYPQSEWMATFAEDPRGSQRRLIPVRVKECQPEGLLKTITYVDLVGLNEESAKARLIAAVRDDRGKPSRPPSYPGVAQVPHEGRPPYPLDHQSREVLSKVKRLEVESNVELWAGTEHHFVVVARGAQNEVIGTPGTTGLVSGDVGTLVGLNLKASTRVGVGHIVWRVGATEATTEVSVVPGPLAALKVVPSSLVIQAYRPIQLSAYGLDWFGNEMLVSPTWTAASGIMTPTGEFCGLQPGAHTVTASVGGISCAATVTVKGAYTGTERLALVGAIPLLDKGTSSIDVTRAQAVTIILHALAKESDAALLRGARAFADTSDHWASGHIALAKAMGLVEGFDDGTFRPDDAITVGETLHLMTRLTNKPATESFEALVSRFDGAHIWTDLTGLVTTGDYIELLGITLFDLLTPEGNTLAQTRIKATPPSVTVDAVDPATFSERIEIKGTVSTDAQAVFVQQSRASVTSNRFVTSVTLNLGVNIIVVKAIDVAGNEAVAEFKVTRVPIPHL